MSPKKNSLSGVKTDKKNPDFNTKQIHAYEIKPLQLIVQPVKSTKLLKIIPTTMYIQYLTKWVFI